MQNTLDKAIKHLPNTNDITQPLLGLQNTLDKAIKHLPSKDDITQPLLGLQNTLDKAIKHLPNTNDTTQFMLDVRESLDTLAQKYPAETVWTELLQVLRSGQSTQINNLNGFAQRLQETTDRMVKQFSQLEEQILQERAHVRETLQSLMTDLSETVQGELRQLQIQFQENSNELAIRLADQSKELDTQNEVDSGLRIQGFADQLAKELKTTLHKLTAKQQEQLHEQNTLLEQRLQKDSAHMTKQVKTSLREGVVDSTQKLHEQMLEMEKLQARSSQEVAEKISDVIFSRLEHTFGTLTMGLAELRERFSSERNSIVATMENWIEDSSRSDQEKAQKIDQKISEVITHVNTHHDDLINVIDLLNLNLSNDMDGMRDKLLSKNEEGTQHVVQKVTDLGQVLEGVVNSVGQEQTIFIEMLGERLETLRRRMKVK